MRPDAQLTPSQSSATGLDDSAVCNQSVPPLFQSRNVHAANAPWPANAAHAKQHIKIPMLYSFMSYLLSLTFMVKRFSQPFQV